MENYTYNFEIRTNILHFMAAIDGAVVKRYDKNKVPKQEIKVNYVYGPKSAILKDLTDKANHIKFPIVAITLKGMKRNSERVKNKLDGYYKHSLPGEDTFSRVRSPIPLDLSFNLHALTTYQSDAEQIINNWAAYFDPYIVVSWKEPYTGYELRSKIIWDGTVEFVYPEEQNDKTPYRIEVKANFTFEGWLFKAQEESVGKICCIDTEFNILSSTYCFWDNLIEMEGDKETFHIGGVPEMYDIYPLVITPNRTWNVVTNGNYININSVFVSGDNPDMFPMSAFNYFPDRLDEYPVFNGYPIETFQHWDNFISFDVEPLSSGRMDVIVVNECGYSSLLDDMKNHSNPYPDYHPFYPMWEEVSLSGIDVLGADPLSAGKLYVWNKYYYENRE